MIRQSRHFCTLLAMGLLVAGCSNNSNTRIDESGAAETEMITDANIETSAVAEGSSDPWRWAKPWDWFAGSEYEAKGDEMAMHGHDHEPAASANWNHSQPQWASTEGVRYSEPAEAEKGPFDFLAFWKHDNESTQNPTAPEQLQFVEDKSDENPFGKLAFWDWGKNKEPEKSRIELDDVLKDMSPELQTGSETKGEARIRRARTYDTNTRRIWDDLSRTLLLDRPSRLSLSPTP